MQQSRFFLATVLLCAFLILSGNAVIPAFAAEVKKVAVKKAEVKKTAVKKTQKEETFVADKNGSEYHKLFCPKAKRIKPKDLVTFKSAAAAKKMGYYVCEMCMPF